MQTEYTDCKFALVNCGCELARAGTLAATDQLSRDEKTRAEIPDHRRALNLLLGKAAAIQQAARVSIYDALLVNRFVVGSLVIVTFLNLLTLQRQLRRTA